MLERPLLYSSGIRINTQVTCHQVIRIVWRDTWQSSIVSHARKHHLHMFAGMLCTECLLIQVRGMLLKLQEKCYISNMFYNSCKKNVIIFRKLDMLKASAPSNALRCLDIR